MQLKRISHDKTTFDYSILHVLISFALYTKDRHCTSSTGSALSERVGLGEVGGLNGGAKYNRIQ